MRRKCLIDGYNLLMRWRRGKIKPGPGNLQRARDALLAWLEPRITDEAETTIVFDAAGADQGGSSVRRTGRLKVVFATDHRSADDWIIETCAQLSGSPVLVVSNDWEVRQAAQRARADVISSDDFLADLRNSPFRDSEPVDSNVYKGEVPEKPETSDFDKSDLEQFRREMAIEDDSNARSEPTGPDSKDGSRSPRRSAEPGLADFHRDMREASSDPEST